MMEEFSEIYKQYRNPIFGFMLKLTAGEIHLAEELTQECFFQAFLSLHKYKGKSTFFVWLCAIAKNCYYKKMKKQRELVMDITLLANQLADADHTEGLFEAKELSIALRKAIFGLNRRQRDVVILRVYFEMSHADISKLLKISEESSKVLFFRAKQKLKSSLRE